MLVKKWNKKYSSLTQPGQSKTTHNTQGLGKHEIYTKKKNMFQHVYLCCCSHSLLYIKLTIYLLKYYY